MIKYLVFLFILFPNLIWAQGTVTFPEVYRQRFITDRIQSECDDIRPLFVPAPDKIRGVFESRGKGQIDYQELSYYGVQDKKFRIGLIIRSESAGREDVDFFSLPNEEERFYAGYISFTKKEIPSVVFNKGLYELDRYDIFGNQPVPLLSFEKKEKEDVIFLRVRGSRVNKVFYLGRDGLVGTSSSSIKEGDWEPVVIINGDCSKDELVFVSNLAGADGDLYVFKLPEAGTISNISPIKRLTFNDNMEMNPKWSPDGKSIVYSSHKEGNMDIYLIPDASAENITPIPIATDTTTDECNPTFSPDGKMIAYYITTDKEKGNLWVMKSNGEDKRRIAEAVFKNDMYGPCWVSYYGTPTLIYIYGSQDKMEMWDAITKKTQEIITEDKVMRDVNCIFQNNEFYITYSARDNNTGRKRIFIKTLKK